MTKTVLHRGKIAKDIEITGIRELTRDDLSVLTERREGTTVQKLRDPHHRLARMVAAGLRPMEIVARSGYSHARFMTIKNDPAFVELVSHYRKVVDDEFKESVDDFFEIATSNMMKAERQLAEHLDKADEEGELLPVKHLLDISRDAADRFGYGKRNTTVNVNVDFAAKLEAAVARSRLVSTTIDQKAVTVAPALSPPGPVRAVPTPATEQAQPIRRRA